MNGIDLMGVFGIAIMSALSHCIGMCGGIVVAYSRILESSSHLAKLIAHLLYGFGRIFSYCVIGGICAFLGSSISVSGEVKGVVFIIVGILMAFLGIGILIPKILAFIEINVLNFGIFRKIFGRVLGDIKSGGIKYMFFLGILNGFIPCGIVYFFALSASVSGSVINGILVMLVFGVATLVPMFLFGALNSLLYSLRFRKIISIISAILVVAFGAWTMFKGIKML